MTKKTEKYEVISEELVNKKVDMIIDWASFSCLKSQFKDYKEFLSVIGIDHNLFEFHEWSPVIGYDKHYSFEKINLHINDERFFLEMSGRGTRTFESYNNLNVDLTNEEEKRHCWYYLFSMVKHYMFSFTRLDIAFDFYNTTKYLTWQKARQHISNKWISSRACKGSYVYNVDFSKKKDEGFTGYIGSRKSETYVRIYDKLAEREQAEYKLTVPIKSWTRLEMVFRRGHAQKFIIDLLENDLNIEYVAKSKINQYLRFVIPTREDTNVRRWDSASWWDKFLATAGKLKLADARVQTSIQQKIHWHENAVSKSLFQTLIFADNPFAYISDLLNIGFEKASDADLALVSNALLIEKKIKMGEEQIKEKLTKIKTTLELMIASDTIKMPKRDVYGDKKK